jgi:signal transduction histidine kinase
LSERLAAQDSEILLWTMGLLCGFVGAFILVAPHHFNSLLYDGLEPFKAWWGVLALCAGAALLAVAALKPSQWICLTAHWAVGLTLLALSASFARSNAWTGVISYGVLGLGTALAPFRPRSREIVAKDGDLFALLMGLVATMIGLILTTAPNLFRSGYYFSVNPLSVPVLGLVVMGTGFLLFCAQLVPLRKLWQLWGVHLAAGGALVVYGGVVSLPNRSPTGLVLYWGCGAAVALLPWLRRRVATLDTGALRTRLALALATATSLALILSVAVVTTQEERLAESQVLLTQQMEADAVARNVSDYVEMNGARTFAVAALASHAPRSAESLRDLLAGSRQAYPDVAGFRVLDLAGTVVASSGDLRLSPGLFLELAARMRREPILQLDFVRRGDRPLLLLAAPIHQPGAGLIGVMVAAFDTGSLVERMTRRGSSISLADGYGRLIAHRDLGETAATSRRSPGVPPLPEDWDRRVRAGEELESATGLVAFAVVPKLNWVVAVERPRASALAGVRRGRDMAFGLLLLLIPLAVVGGVFVSRRIARPLGTLADAVSEMAAGNPSAPLGTTGITELARLSTAFQEMRDRLAERTEESERLATELRARAEALAETDRRKDEFLAMLAHELRNPLGAISNASYILEQSAPVKPEMARPVAIIRRQILHLVRMVDDLLDVSRITRGKVELRKEPVDLVEVVLHAVEASRATVEAKSHTLRVSLPDEPLPLVADATRLEQVLSNLLRNSAKFTEAGGRIEIEAQRDGVGAVVTVRDDGIGIAGDLLPRVFDLFAQGEQALDRSGAGLGIGLTLVRSLVEMHGGRVEAKSDGPGRGSEFVVWLPLVPAHQAQRHAAAAGQGRDLVS